MRVVGPNCLGVANLHHLTALNATFAPGTPTPGSVAFASQSGAFGIAAIDEAAARGIGLSSFVSMGDKADLSSNDFLEYWEQDPDTSVLLVYVESFGSPRRFGRIARRITASKPIVAVKSGRTGAGRRAASSHTGALLAASDVTVDALFAAAGVLRAETVGEMFDVAGLLARQPLPPGDRVAVVTIFVRPLAARAAGVARRIAAAAEGAERPVLAVWLGADTPGPPTPARCRASRARRRRCARWVTPSGTPASVRRRRTRPASPPPTRPPAATIVAAGLGEGGGWLAPRDVERLPVPRPRCAAGASVDASTSSAWPRRAPS
jgi:hypothetical protein